MDQFEGFAWGVPAFFIISFELGVSDLCLFDCVCEERPGGEEYGERAHLCC